jgi:hypothetical protein
MTPPGRPLEQGRLRRRSLGGSEDGGDGIERVTGDLATGEGIGAAVGGLRVYAMAELVRADRVSSPTASC